MKTTPMLLKIYKLVRSDIHPIAVRNKGSIICKIWVRFLSHLLERHGAENP